MLGKYGNEKIGLKLMGSLDTVNWKKTIGHKFKNDKAYINFVESWDARVRQHDFVPTKKISLGDVNSKVELNPDDEELMKLRNKYGPLVSESVAKCFLEIEEGNPCGRYMRPMPWNFEADRTATMNEIIDHLELVMTANQIDLEAMKLELKATERDSEATKAREKDFQASTISKISKIKATIRNLEAKGYIRDLRAEDVDSTSKVKAESGAKVALRVRPKRKRSQS